MPRRSLPDEGPADTPRPPAARPVYADTVGYVQHIDVAALSDCSTRMNGRIWIAALPGSFVHKGSAGGLDRRVGTGAGIVEVQIRLQKALRALAASAPELLTAAEALSAVALPLDAEIARVERLTAPLQTGSAPARD